MFAKFFLYYLKYILFPSYLGYHVILLSCDQCDDITILSRKTILNRNSIWTLCLFMFHLKKEIKDKKDNAYINNVCDDEYIFKQKRK